MWSTARKMKTADGSYSLTMGKAGLRKTKKPASRTTSSRDCPSSAAACCPAASSQRVPKPGLPDCIEHPLIQDIHALGGFDSSCYSLDAIISKKPDIYKCTDERLVQVRNRANYLKRNRATYDKRCLELVGSTSNNLEQLPSSAAPATPAASEAPPVGSYRDQASSDEESSLSSDSAAEYAEHEISREDVIGGRERLLKSPPSLLKSPPSSFKKRTPSRSKPKVHFSPPVVESYIPPTYSVPPPTPLAATYSRPSATPTMATKKQIMKLIKAGDIKQLMSLIPDENQVCSLSTSVCLKHRRHLFRAANFVEIYAHVDPPSSFMSIPKKQTSKTL